MVWVAGDHRVRIEDQGVEGAPSGALRLEWCWAAWPDPSMCRSSAGTLRPGVREVNEEARARPRLRPRRPRGPIDSGPRLDRYGKMDRG